jgi:hypothetical protein
VVGIKKIRMRRAPKRVKYPNMIMTLPTNSKTMAPNRKKDVFDMPNLAMYWAVPSKFPIFPIPELRKIKTRRTLPVKLTKALNHSMGLTSFYAKGSRVQGFKGSRDSSFFSAL